MTHDQSNRFEIFRLEPAAEAETLEAAQLAALTMIEDEDGAATFLVHDNQPGDHYTMVVFGHGQAPALYRSGLLESSGMLLKTDVERRRPDPRD